MRENVLMEKVEFEFEEVEAAHGGRRLLSMPTHYHDFSRRSTEAHCEAPSCYEVEDAVTIDATGGDEHNAGSGSFHYNYMNLTGFENATMEVKVEVEFKLSKSLESLEEVFSLISIIIVLIFALEIVILIFGMGPDFFCHAFFMLDFIVVGVTLFCKWAIPSDFAAQMVIILRLWRFVRIIHGVYAAEHENLEKQEEAKEKAEEAEMLEAGASSTAKDEVGAAQISMTETETPAADGEQVDVTVGDTPAEGDTPTGADKSCMPAGC
jgi:hypothetical protein